MSEKKPQSWSIEPIAAEHDCSSFDCGKQPLNDWLSKYALLNHRLGVGRTFVAIVPGQKRVDGYYCVSAGAVAFDNLPQSLAKGLPRYPTPVGHLGRLAVDKKIQKQGLGETLLFDALESIVRAADFVGIHAIEAIAKDEEAKGFYLKYGFTALCDDPLHLYVKVKTLKKLHLL